MTKLVSVLFLVVLILLAFNWQSVLRMYSVITLFDEDKIVRNFGSMNESFSSIDIASDAEPYYFGHSPQDIPSSFEYQGEQVSTDSFLERTATTALLVIQDEDIRFEKYYQATEDTDQRISWSVAKSFLSAVFGVVVAQGNIKSIDDLVTDYVPSLLGSGYDGVTIKNVLQMSSGVQFNEDYNDFFSDINRMGRVMALGGSFDEFAASLVASQKQGTQLHYVSIDTHVLGMVLRGATGKSIAELFKTHLWDHIQPEANTYYITDEEREPMVLGGLNMRTRDFAKLGKLYRDGGRWNSKQVIPETWVEASITPDAPHLMPGKRSLGYGYQWWVPVNADQEFMAVGIYGQFIYVNRKADLVIVKNSAHIDFANNNGESLIKTTEFFRAIANALSVN